MHAAEIDDRIKAVVAIGVVKSMETMPVSIRAYYRQVHPYRNMVAQWFLSDRMLTRAIERAGVLADFDPDASDRVKVIQRMDTPVLLIHGGDDENCPVEGAQAIHAARPTHTKLIIYENEDHWSYLTRDFDDLRGNALEWMARHMVAQPIRELISSSEGG